MSTPTLFRWVAALLLAPAVLPSGEGRPPGVVSGTPPGLVAAEGWLMPNLTASAATHLWIELRDEDDGRQRRLLHFATTIWNLGSGPLDLVGDPPEPLRGTRVPAAQRLWRRSGATLDLPVGDFVYHAVHQHWHLNTFARYDLYALREDGPPVRVRTSGKVTFCILNSDRARGTPVHPVDQDGCGLSRQRLSAGWGDTYGSYTPGQDLDVTDLPDGRYALHTTADPDGVLRELDEGDNTSVMRFEMTGDVVRPLGS